MAGCQIKEGKDFITATSPAIAIRELRRGRQALATIARKQPEPFPSKGGDAGPFGDPASLSVLGFLQATEGLEPVSNRKIPILGIRSRYVRGSGVE